MSSNLDPIACGITARRLLNRIRNLSENHTYYVAITASRREWICILVCCAFNGVVWNAVVAALACHLAIVIAGGGR